MKLLNSKNLIYKIFSVVLAILLWLYVGHQENPMTEQVFTIPLEVRDLAPTLVIAERPSFVKVRIEGQRQNLSSVTTGDIYAFLELDGIDAGMHLMDINVSVPNKTRLVSISPANINLKVETVAQKQVPVVVSFADKIPAEGYMALDPVINPTQVLISGPEDKLKEINQVFVEVNLGEAITNYHQQLPAKVADSSGNLLPEWVTMEPKDIDVLVPVIRELPSKSVPIKVPLTGSPAEGYKVERVVIEPAVIPLYGEYEKIDRVDSLETAAVSVKGASGDVIKRVALKVPDGLKVIDTQEVMVVVRIGKIEKKTYTVSIDQLGLSTEQIALLDTNTVEVVLEGSVSLMEKIALTQIQASVDLSGLAVGKYQLPVQLVVPEGAAIKEVRPGKVNVTLQ